MPGCETGVMKVRERVIKEAYKLFDNSCEYFNPSNIDDETISQLNSLGESYEKLFRDSRLERVSNSGLVTTHSLLSLISPNDRALSEEMRMQKLRMFRKALFGDSDVGEEFLRQRNSGYDPSSSFFDSDLEASSNGNTEKSREGIPSGILKGVGCCLIGFLTLGFGSGALCPSKALAADNIYTPVGSHFSTGVSTDLTKNTSLDIDTQVKANEVVDLGFRGILGLGREEPFLYKFRIRAQPSKNFLIYTSLGRNKLTTSNELPWSIGAGFDMSEAVHIGCNLSNKEAVSKRGTLKDESEVCSALNLDVDLGKDKKIGAIGKYIGDEKIFGKNTGWGVGGYFGSNVPYKIMAILPWDDEFLMNSFLNNTSKDKITSYIGFDYSTKHLTKNSKSEKFHVSAGLGQSPLNISGDLGLKRYTVRPETPPGVIGVIMPTMERTSKIVKIGATYEVLDGGFSVGPVYFDRALLELGYSGNHEAKEDIFKLGINFIW